MTLALIAVALVFAALLIARFAGARRVELLRRWPSLVLGTGAAIALMRGQIWFGLGLAGGAAILWVLTPEPRAPARPAPRTDAEDAAARAILGVGPHATKDDIRAAYRAKMAKAHPDRGGSNAEAARLTAARDRLLKR
jgi:hypothetical protein